MRAGIWMAPHEGRDRWQGYGWHHTSCLEGVGAASSMARLNSNIASVSACTISYTRHIVWGTAHSKVIV